MSRVLSVIWLISVLVVIEARQRNAYHLDERWVCNVKKSCLECLTLSYCSWCKLEKICYSKNIPKFSNYCENNTVDHEDYGLSIEENAECACAGGQLEHNCYPLGVTEGPECSDRGTCVCGHCVCDPNPVPEYPTKTVMGEFCEFDNFSCDGPKCNEGPYSQQQPRDEDGSSKQLENYELNKNS